MSYINMSPEIKAKGKAVVDLIGFKLGKALAGGIQIFTFILLPTSSYSELAIYYLAIILLVCFIWIKSILQLGKELNL